MAQAPIGHLATRTYRIPTDAPEADGTFAWNTTTLMVVEIEAGGAKGLGYTFADAASAQIVLHVLADAICGIDAFAIPRAWAAMVAAVRNIGWRGVSASAISAVDVALWDLKSRLLAVPLTRLLGQLRDEVPVYGSGGFTSYSIERLQQQLAAWTQHDGCRGVKMKVGTAPDEDVHRVSAAREVIGEASLYVDANGAYARKQALALANEFADLGVVWFEEPVSSDDREGLRLIRDRSPASIEIAAGEYGYDPFYFRRMLEAGAVDVLQADATRCGGYTGFLKVAALAQAWGLPLSAHTAPALHLPVCCAAPGLRNIEWFHDHVRIEQRLFDGSPVPKQGCIRPDLTRLGHGLSLKAQDAERMSA